MIPGNPHAPQLVTRGIIGSTVGLASRGYIVTIEEFVYVPPTHVPKGAAGIRGLREDKKKKKIVVTVEAYGKKFVHTEIVKLDASVKIKDLEIIDDGKENITVKIKNIRIKKI